MNILKYKYVKLGLLVLAILLILYIALRIHMHNTLMWVIENAPLELTYIDKNKQLSDKELILILPGLGYLASGRANAKQHFAQYNDIGYDVIIPYYVDKDSIANTLNNLSHSIDKFRIKEYKKVYVVAYIIGGHALTYYLQENDFDNLSHIIYDRSPIQEQGPETVIKYYPLNPVSFGKSLHELMEGYPTIHDNPKIKAGLMIESTAIPRLSLMYRFINFAIPEGGFQWQPEAFGVPYIDYFYTWAHHEEASARWDAHMPEYMHFFLYDKFSKEAPRSRFIFDPWANYDEPEYQEIDMKALIQTWDNHHQAVNN